MKLAFNHPQRQAGASLLIGLLILTLLTLLALVSVKANLLQQKIVAAWTDQERAFQQVEIALARIESMLMGMQQPPPLCEEACTAADMIWQRGQAPLHPQLELPDWWRQHGYPIAGTGGSPPPVSAGTAVPIETRVLVELVHIDTSSEQGELAYYRITGAGLGRGSSMTVLQSIVAKPYFVVDPANDSDPCPEPSQEDDQPDSEATLHCGRIDWRRLA